MVGRGKTSLSAGVATRVDCQPAGELGTTRSDTVNHSLSHSIVDLYLDVCRVETSAQGGEALSGLEVASLH